MENNQALIKQRIQGVRSDLGPELLLRTLASITKATSGLWLEAGGSGCVWRIHRAIQQTVVGAEGNSEHGKGRPDHVFLDLDPAHAIKETKTKASSFGGWNHIVSTAWRRTSGGP